MNRQSLLQYVEKKHQKKEPAAFRVGDTVRVHVRITEGDATRVQVFEGVVIALKGQGGTQTFTVRKISFGIGVERCFPLVSPTLDKIDVVRSGHVRRAKLYYLRERVGRSAKLDEKETSAAETKKTASSGSGAPASAELVAAEEK